MRFTVALASLVLGAALLAGFVFRDSPEVGVAKSEVMAEQPASQFVLDSQPVQVREPARARELARLGEIAPARQVSDARLATSSVEKSDTDSNVLKFAAPKAIGEIAAAQPTVLNADRSRFESVVTAPAPVPVTKSQEARDKRILVMALQGELRRVGCYKGAVDGTWHTSSKSAMFWFLKRVNAKLPVNTPDPALLELVKSADEDACLEKDIPPSQFVTEVVKDNPASNIGPDSDSFAAARRRAGIPEGGQFEGAVAAGPDAVDLPDPMAVGRVEPEDRPRRSYSARDRQVEDLFKHPLGRF